MSSELPPGFDSWPRLLISAYGPTLLASIGFGAIIPLVALQATNLGASIGLAAFISGLSGVATLFFDLPAGTIAAKLGERVSIITACLIDSLVLAMVFFANSLPTLALAVFVHGMTGSIFGLARQNYLAEIIPLKYRARAMSTLGGVFRVGGFIGPLVAAALLARGEIKDAFIFAACTSFLAAIVTLFLPDLPSERRMRTDASGAKPKTLQILNKHRHALLTAGLGCLGIMMVRATRQTIIPLWGEAMGLSPAIISLLYSLSMLFDVALFYPGGWIMDKFGRWFVCVPSMFAMSTCLLILPLATNAWTIAILACLLGLGNGVSSGIVMTLGADASPSFGRPQFLAGWRLLSDTGNSSGPLLISLVSSIANLAASSVTVGVLGLVAAWWLAKWVPKKPEELAAFRPND